jgi:hypothetical protein
LSKLLQANVLGSLFGWLGKFSTLAAVSFRPTDTSTVALALDRAHRRQRAINALYAPLSEEPEPELDSDDEYEDGLRQAAFRAPASSKQPRRQGSLETIDSLRMANVWDEREELFGVGSDDGDEQHDGHSYSVRR